MRRGDGGLGRLTTPRGQGRGGPPGMVEFHLPACPPPRPAAGRAHHDVPLAPGPARLAAAPAPCLRGAAVRRARSGGGRPGGAGRAGQGCPGLPETPRVATGATRPSRTALALACKVWGVYGQPETLWVAMALMPASADGQGPFSLGKKTTLTDTCNQGGENPVHWTPESPAKTTFLHRMQLFSPGTTLSSKVSASFFILFSANQPPWSLPHSPCSASSTPLSPLGPLKCSRAPITFLCRPAPGVQFYVLDQAVVCIRKSSGIFNFQLSKSLALCIILLEHLSPTFSPCFE